MTFLASKSLCILLRKLYSIIIIIIVLIIINNSLFTKQLNTKYYYNILIHYSKMILYDNNKYLKYI